MRDIRELYQQVIIDHNRCPRNCGALAEANCQAKGVNPLCGDELTVYLQLDGDTITAIRFQGKGCAISTASASLMTEALQGKTITYAKKIFEQFHTCLTEEAPTHGDELGKLTVLTGVREFPVRIKCATLAWHTLKAALDREKQPITTE
jgi:nitrogen fixation protein NifU and related proteins